jgi:hypothetical protein
MVLTRMTAEGREFLLLWTGVLASPLAWLAQLGGSYLLASRLCGHGHGWLLHLLSVAALLVVGAGATAAWSARSRFGASEGDAPLPTAECRRFMVAVGLALSALFALAIVASFIPTAMLSPCVS